MRKIAEIFSVTKIPEKARKIKGFGTSAQLSTKNA